MAGSARPTVSEYMSYRNLTRLIEKTNRAKSDLRDLVKNGGAHRRSVQHRTTRFGERAPTMRHPKMAMKGG